MASAYKETHKIAIKGVLNLEDNLIEIEDGTPVAIGEILEKFNGAEISFSVQLTNELDK